MAREIKGFMPGDYLYFPNGSKFPNGLTDYDVQKIWIGAIRYWEIRTDVFEDGSYYKFDTIFYSDEYPLVKIVSVTESSYTIDGGTGNVVVCNKEKIDKVAELWDK